MKLLTIGSDRLLFEPHSNVRARVEAQAALVEDMHVIVFARRLLGLREAHAGNLHIYPTNSRSKLGYISDALRIAKHISFDFVSAQDPFEAGFVAWRVASARNVPLQLQIHTDVFSPMFVRASLLNRVRVVLAQFLLPRTSSMRVVSQRIANSLKRLHLKGKVTVLPIYIDLEAMRAEPAGNHSDFARFSKRVLVVSRLEKEKNVEEALQIFKNVVQQFPDIGLLIAGSGSQKSALQVQTLGITSQVVFLNHRRDIYALYAQADVLLVTSWYEGFGAQMVEALAAGCAVVAPDVGVAREAGALVVERDRLSDAVVEVLQSNAKGHLQLPLLSKDAWLSAWKESFL